MRPSQSYIIWFTQRSGSTLLCKGLEETQIGGKPGEYFTLMGENSLCEKHQVSNYEDLKNKLWELGTSSNGAFGIKVPLHFSRIQKIFDEIKALNNSPSDNPLEILSEIFPNCQHIYLSRRNRIRQVVSWWRAIHDNVWHLEKGQTHRNDLKFYEEKYNFDALSHLFKESILMECSVQRFFDQNNITPFNVFYEDFIKNYDSTMLAILDFLKIDFENLEIQAPYYAPTADGNSEIWVKRFAEDLQKDWSEIVY